MTLDEYLADLAAKARRHTAGPSVAAEKSRIEFDDAFSPDVATALVAVAEAAHEYLAKPHIGAEAEETGMRAALARLTALARTR